MDKGPGHIVQEVPVNLPHPRRKKDRAFLDLVDQIYGIITGKTQDEAIELGSAPGTDSANIRALPHVPINQISGLVEQIHSEPESRADVYQLSPLIDLRLDELLPVVDAVELLGFVIVDAGDLMLTPLGKKFAEADIRQRKDIFAVQLRRVPMISWIEHMLASAEGHQLEKDVLLTALALDFDAEQVPQQLITAINWGRYAEIFGFDDDNDNLFLGATQGDPELAEDELNTTFDS
jgi:NitT/TauT family transport system ATP-binding protein